MKKFFVIGNPIKHSLSPKLHNYWIRKNKLDAIYEKEKINKNDIKNIISEIRKEKIDGINVTTPFKNSVIPFLDELSSEASNTQSVNTVYKKEGKIIGHNTDIAGFELGLRYIKYNVENKKIFIMGAGGVSPSIIIALKKLGAGKIILSNRTKKKAEALKNFFSDLEIINWGEVPNFDMIINTTSLGLNESDEIKLNYSDIGSNKFFYDIIYNPKQTDFLKKGKELGNKIENGEKMFVYQAASAFKIWHGISPEINDELTELLK